MKPSIPIALSCITLTAAAITRLRLLHIHTARRPTPPWTMIPAVQIRLDLPGQCYKRLLYVRAGLGARLNKWNPQLVRQRLALRRGHNAPVSHVGLVGNKNKFNGLGCVLLDIRVP